MDTIRLIASPRELRAYIDSLRKRNVHELALDLEADQGMYRYRYSVSIVQCFDGAETTVVDVLSLRDDTEPLRELLEAPDIAKVMFSAKNDLFITRNVLGCGIVPLRDIAVAQKILGIPVNLSERIGIGKAEKDRFQRANWLRRQLPKDLLRYAAGDVAPLLQMEMELRARLEDRSLSARYRDACEALSRTDYSIDQYRLYERKFPGYRRLSPELKRRARVVWLFREYLGERLDRPVGYLLSTKTLPRLLDGKGSLADRLDEALNEGRRPEKRLSRATVETLMKQAEAAEARRTA